MVGGRGEVDGPVSGSKLLSTWFSEWGEGGGGVDYVGMIELSPVGFCHSIVYSIHCRV